MYPMAIQLLQKHDSIVARDTTCKRDAYSYLSSLLMTTSNLSDDFIVGSGGSLLEVMVEKKLKFNDVVDATKAISSRLKVKVAKRAYRA